MLRPSLLTVVAISVAACASLEPPIPPVAITNHVVTVGDYPADSVKMEEQGRVLLKYLVKQDGNVGECIVTQSSGIKRLDDAACAMVTKRWKFKPALQNGKPVAAYRTAEVVFQLK